MQKRDRHLLAELDVLRVADREQLMAIRAFGSVRRINDRLHRLVEGGLLRRYFVGTISGGKKAVYCLSARGAALVGGKPPAMSYRQDQLITSDQFLSHQLAINEVYLSCKYKSLPEGVSFVGWKNFVAPLSETIRLIPDGYVELNTPAGIRCLFVEVDLGTESLKVWQQKVELYLQLAVSGEFTALFNQPKFSVLVLASSDRRLLSIKRLVAGMTDKIFYFSTTEATKAHNLTGCVWLRPLQDHVTNLL